MSRSSIFDNLYKRRQPVSEVPEAPSELRNDYDTERLRVIDGIALTPAGFVSSGECPEDCSPTLSTELHGIDGFRIPVYEITDLPIISEPELERFETKALRIHQLIQSVIVEALMMLESVPENAKFDVQLSFSLGSDRAIALIKARLKEVISETQYAPRLGEIRHQEVRQEPHDVLKAADVGGMPYILWIGVDSVVNEEDIFSFVNRPVLAQSGSDNGIFPGEAVAVLLIQRLAEENDTFDSGWLLERGVVQEHAPRSELKAFNKRQQIDSLLSDVWLENDQEEAESREPSILISDVLGIPDRAVEIGGSVLERWPQLEMLRDCRGADGLCGWAGEALSVLIFVMAISQLETDSDAIVLSVASEKVSKGWALRSYIKIAAQSEENQL